MGMQDENVDVFAPTAPLDSSGTSITGRCPHDHHVLLAFLQYIVQQAPQQLQGKILERQGWATEKLHDPLIGVQLNQRGHRFMGKYVTVGLVQHPAEILRRNRIVDKRVHYLESELAVGKPTPAANFFQAEMRQ